MSPEQRLAALCAAKNTLPLPDTWTAAERVLRAVLDAIDAQTEEATP